MSEIKKWLILLACLTVAIALVAIAIVVMPLSIITKIAKRFLESGRDFIQKVADKYKD